MSVKDKVVTWWIQNVILPKREIIDRPGFVVTTFTEKKFKTYLRDFFLPEKLLEIIENRIVQYYGNQGRQALYSAGKKFGYSYCSMSNFPNITNSSQKELLEFAYLFVRYCEGTYAQSAEHNINLDDKVITFIFDNYIICRHNGLGYIMTDGGSAGIWAFVMQDKTLESVQLECQGRNNQKCLVLCASIEKILEKTKTYFCEKDLLDLKVDNTYRTLNQIRKATYTKNSLKDLLNAGFIDFKKGILSYKNNRLFHCDVHLLYLLEKEVLKLQNGDKVLFDACVEYGKLLRETYGKTNYEKFIPDFFSALGFGDILVLEADKLSISSKYYPWTVFSKETKYTVFRGIMSGIVSSSLGKNIEFTNYSVMVGEYLTLSIST